MWQVRTCCVVPCSSRAVRRGVQRAWDQVETETEAAEGTRPPEDSNARGPKLTVVSETAGTKLFKRLNILAWGDLYEDAWFRERDTLPDDMLQSPLDIFLYIRINRSIRDITLAFPLEPPAVNTFYALLLANPRNT
ncbi:hypothetical protein NDU88_003521 [Pleurodeles waltl]|uniref:Uncharacterized protein n=1 Tax=Pleurodeles waltl TaxID=8319 RepID=A0AAV7PH49_PLEWA|nr:hypothetical protein NDU88_003521 [Pleurodeles waltl]